MTRHIVRDGEVILLILKPSLWSILLNSLRISTAVLIIMLGAMLLDSNERHRFYYLEAGIFLIAGRIMWAILQWMGRLYVLTDMRIVILEGIFNVEIFDCALRRVARTGLLNITREKLLGLGSVEIIPQDSRLPVGFWRTIHRPRHVHEQIVAAIRRAQSNHLGDAA